MPYRNAKGLNFGRSVEKSKHWSISNGMVMNEKYGNYGRYLYRQAYFEGDGVYMKVGLTNLGIETGQQLCQVNMMWIHDIPIRIVYFGIGSKQLLLSCFVCEVTSCLISVFLSLEEWNEVDSRPNLFSGKFTIIF